ncbi:14408_t:CDS:2, partial [Dentiscutata heterogama]
AVTNRFIHFEICEDINDLVIQGSFLILFPPEQPPGWTKPETKVVKDRLTENLLFLIPEWVSQGQELQSASWQER